MRPCWIWYVMVSRAMSLRCSRLVHWSSLIMEVGLLWRLKSWKTYLAAFRWTISNLLMLTLVTLVCWLHTVEAYSSCGPTTVCLLTIFLDVTITMSSISVQEPQSAAGFLRDGVNVVVPRKLAVDVHTKARYIVRYVLGKCVVVDPWLPDCLCFGFGK